MTAMQAVNESWLTLTVKCHRDRSQDSNQFIFVFFWPISNLKMSQFTVSEPPQEEKYDIEEYAEDLKNLAEIEKVGWTLDEFYFIFIFSHPGDGRLHW